MTRSATHRKAQIDVEIHGIKKNTGAKLVGMLIVAIDRSPDSLLSTSKETQTTHER